MKYVFILSGVLFMMFPTTVSGGNIDSPAGPGDSGSAMYKVDDIYNRLNSGAVGAKRSGAFAGPVSGPGSASRTLDEVMGVAPAADDTDGAATGDVLSGKTFWGLTSGQWGPQTGAMPNNGAFALSCGAGDQGVTAGYYSGGTLAGDADLAVGNIKSGVDIFGVTGTVIESSGDAAAGDVLTGKTFSNAGAAGVSGTMANNGAVSMTPGTSAQTVTAGYHNGSGTVAGDTDLAVGNIKSGVDIFGVTGTVIESSGDAAAGDVLTGKTFSNAGAAGVSGTMANNGAVSMTPGTSAQTVTAGYHSGSGTVAGDTDLAVGNIKSGVDIFGVTGTVIEASGDAAAGDVLTGKTFSNAGAAGVSGTMADNGAVSMTPGTSAQTVTAGYHNGSGTVAGDADLAVGNIKSGVDIFGVTGTVTESSGDAAEGDVLTGKTFSNAGAAGVSGTMADNGAFALSCGVGDQGVTAGYYSGGTLAGDADLAAGNILSGVDIFGVTGTATAAAYPAIVPKTGQTTTVPINPAPTGSDGDLQRGASWPSPRFTDNSNGTVTDNLTGLIWLKNANCPNAQRDWTTALSDVTQLNTDGTMNGNNCGDTSNGGSNQTDWRLPSRFEFESLLDLRYFSPSVPNTAGTGQWTEGQPFSGVQSNYYWSGSTYALTTTYAWVVSLGTGDVGGGGKTGPYYVWPVRGGQ